MADLATYLVAAWDHSVSVSHPVPSVADCAADVSRETLLAKKLQLERVKSRDHVSRVYLAFIDRVLASTEAVSART